MNLIFKGVKQIIKMKHNRSTIYKLDRNKCHGKVLEEEIRRAREGCGWNLKFLPALLTRLQCKLDLKEDREAAS